MDPYTKFIQAGGFSKVENLGLFLDYIMTFARPGSNFGGAGAVIVAIIFFFLLNALYRNGLVFGAPNGTPLRAVWMWDDNDVKQAPGKFLSSQVVADPVPYLKWAKARGVNRTWIDLINVVGKTQAVWTFLTLAKKQAMQTQFLFASTGSADLAGPGAKEMDDIFKLLLKLDKSLWPTALQTNYETGLLVGGTDAKKAFEAHKMFKTKLDAFNAANGSVIGLTASVLYWWYNYEPGGNPPKVAGKDYGLALLELGVDVTVQDYRDPPEWTILPAKKWCELAGALGRQAWIGLLVGPGTTGGNVHAYAKDMWNLEPDLSDIAKACIDKPGFSGVAVHTAYYYGKETPT
ncbi:MAG: hypothetical protein ACOYOB_19760 [Myxococcota bacterium]|jgi:hypothetical protein